MQLLQVSLITQLVNWLAHSTRARNLATATPELSYADQELILGLQETMEPEVFLLTLALWCFQQDENERSGWTLRVYGPNWNWRKRHGFAKAFKHYHARYNSTISRAHCSHLHGEAVLAFGESWVLNQYERMGL